MTSLGRQLTAILLAGGLLSAFAPVASASNTRRAEVAQVQTVQYYYGPGYYGRPYWRHRHPYWGRGYYGRRYWGGPRYYGPPPGYYHRYRRWHGY